MSDNDSRLSGNLLCDPGDKASGGVRGGGVGGKHEKGFYLEVMMMLGSFRLQKAMKSSRTILQLTIQFLFY